MSVKRNWLFPDPKTADSSGLLCLSENLSVELLSEAYSRGIFPWPTEETPYIPWFSPDPRGVLFFDKFHVSQSLKKFIRKNSGELRFTENKNFLGVIRGCAAAYRKGQAGTWITDEMITVYNEFFNKGHVLSIECWRGQKLVGGIYGVLMNGVFSGESMFGIEDNISKVCLVKLVETLKSRGHTWMDVQMVTPVLKNFGAEYIPRYAVPFPEI